MIIALEGLPAAGKSTTAAELAGRLSAETLLEPTANHPFLSQVYARHRDDATIELAFLLLHANAYRMIDRSATTISDYSPVKDLLFAKELLTGRDLRIFEMVYQHLYDALPIPDVVAYLDVPPKTCLARARLRLQNDETRSFESGLTISRLSALRRRYHVDIERLGQKVSIVELDGTEKPEKVANLVETAIIRNLS